MAPASVRGFAMKLVTCFALVLLAPAAPTAPASAQAPFTIEDLVRVQRVEEPVVSPDGRFVAFAVRETKLESNRRQAHLWLLDLSAPHSMPRQLTGADTSDFDPRWGTDSQTLYFLSTRSGSTQVWRLAMQGGEAQQVTHVPVDVTSLRVGPTGEHIAF